MGASSQTSRLSTGDLSTEMTPRTGPNEIFDEEQLDAAAAQDSKGEVESGPQTADNYPHGLSLLLICVGLTLGVLCVGLDRAIIATAIPKITVEFNSLDDIGWYGSAYLLTSCCFQLMFGKLYAELNIKWVFMAALCLFEVGSIICAAAPNSLALIIGRAVAGLGSSGIVTGALIILAQSVPLHNRPKVTGAIGGAAGIAQVVAPTLGGVFTDYATWRWCFWINLPLGGITFFVVFFLVKLPPNPNSKASGSIYQALQKFDLLGTSFLVPALVCLLLALQWGGSQYAWSNWRIILTLCIFCISILLWGFVQISQGDRATVPLRIISMRSIACAMWFMFCLMGALFTIIQFVPIWFQAIRDTSASRSGINFLATTASQSVLALLSGFITSKIGYYVPQMLASTILMSVATGMITRFGLDTSTGYWVASLVLLGFGVGIGGQQPIMVPQTVLTGSDISLGTSLMVFTQTMSGTVFSSVGNNIFQDGLVSGLADLPVDPAVVISAGASGLVQSMTEKYPEFVDEILGAYAQALQRVWKIPVVLACLGVFGSSLMEWRSVKKDLKATPVHRDRE